VWAHPDLLPTDEDFDDPDGFVHGREDWDISALEEATGAAGSEGATGAAGSEGATGAAGSEGATGETPGGDGEPGDGPPDEPPGGTAG